MSFILSPPFQFADLFIVISHIRTKNNLMFDAANLRLNVKMY